MSQTLDILFSLLEKKWTDHHLITTSSLSAAAGLLLPFWGALLSALKWFKEYKNASKERKEEMIRLAKKEEMRILTEAITKNLSEILEESKKKDESETPTT